MGSLTLRMLEEVVRSRLGALPDTGMEFRELVNMAGHHLVSMAPWKWLEGRQLEIRLRPEITFTGGTWTEATKTLTKTGAFADYSYLSGDTVAVEGGTGATTGTYAIASRTSDDAIVLVTSIGAAANGQTDIEATLRNDQASIPSGFDFQSVTACALTDNLVGSFEFTSTQGLLDLRTWPGLSSTVSFWAVLSWVRDTFGGQPSLRLEVWPTTTDSSEQISLFYRGGWKEPDTDSEELGIPAWINSLFIEIVVAFARGYSEPEGAPLDGRLSILRSGPLFLDALTRDGMLQPDLGPMSGTWMGGQASSWSDRFSLYNSPTI